jgi:hypothetical protein
LFEWTAGELRGYTARGVTLKQAVVQIVRAIDFQKEIAKTYGKLPPQEILEQMNLLDRWMRMACAGRLKIKIRRRKDKARSVYHNVEEID